MRTRTITLIAPFVTAGLILTGCSAGPSGPGGTNTLGTTNDINPQPVSALRDGGNLRLANTSYPSTFNALHVDADGEVADLVAPTLPAAFTSDAAGELSIDHNYFTDIELTDTEPQQVTYTINPKAVWSDGSPITWEDLASEANALSGKNKEFQVGAINGFDRVAKVERGTDDRQAIVTFDKHYAEWKGQFSPLYPKSVTATPQSFDNAARNELKISSGPFMITDYNRGQNRIVLSRNPRWWGDTPKLSTITYSVLDISAEMTALQNNELDGGYISSLSDVKTARSTPGLVVRRAGRNYWSHMTFNGAPGAILSDAKLRVAISKAIDRQAIATASQNGIVDNPRPLNNHVFVFGQKGYQDNSAPVAFDPAAAARELDALGWKLNGQFREKDGRKLVLRDVMLKQDSWVQTAQIAQQNLAKVGVKLEIQTFPGTGLFTNVIDPGNFDIAQFSWSGSALPLIALTQIYAYDPANIQGNKGRIGTPEINALVEQAISELDPDKAIELANKVDLELFKEGFSLPLTQSAGNYAMRPNIANWGAFGLASPDYTKVGFLK